MSDTVPEVKECLMCGEVKPLSDYWKASRPDGRATWCKPCSRAYYQTYKDNLDYKRRRRAATLKNRYNITLEQYEQMLEEQGGVCAACGGKCKTGVNLAVDHDHYCCPKEKGSCGKCVRGLLCRSCNQIIGFLERDNDHLYRYLVRTGSIYLNLSPHGAVLDTPVSL